MLIKEVTPQELRKLNASDFKHGDLIDIMVNDRRKYTIHINYIREDGKVWDNPYMLSWVEDEYYKPIDCTPGSSKGFTPYYIDEFKRR
jgi:hypothetical protein